MESSYLREKQENVFSKNNNTEEKNALNPLEVWKSMYYLTERSWGDLVKSTISTDSASKNMLKFMNSYLDLEKISRKSMEQYFEIAPIPSKKDIARVAKLVIGVEDKVDNLESAVEVNLDRLINTLAVLVDTLSPEQKAQTVEHEISQTKEEIEAINQKLSTLISKVEELTSHAAAFEAVMNKTSNSKQTQGKSVKRQQSEAPPAKGKVEDDSQ